VNVVLVAGAGPAGPAADALREVGGVGEVEVVVLPEPAGRAELDPVLNRLAGRRLVVAGSPAALGDVLTRLLRRDELGTTPVGVIGPSPAGRLGVGGVGRDGVWVGDPTGHLGTDGVGRDEVGAGHPAGGLGAGGVGRDQVGPVGGRVGGVGAAGGLAAAARIAVAGLPVPADLVRDDHGGVLVDRAELTPWRGRRLGLRAYVDDTPVADGEVAGLTVLVTGRGTLVARARPGRRWRAEPARAAAGRAVQVSCAEAGLTVDGRAHPRPVTRRNWWVEPGRWLLMRSR
jgi:hypothetical protein